MEYPHIMLFDLYAGGHNGQYIEQLLRFWVQHTLKGRLTVVVPTFFVQKYPSIPALIHQHQDHGLELIPITDDVDVDTPHRFQLLHYDREHRRLLRKYIELIKPDHCLLMSFDHVQVSLSFDLRFDFPVSLSGIYFRPSFHYDSFGNGKITLRERVQHSRKEVLLRAALHNPHFRFLFSLDPYAVPFVQKMVPSVQTIALPDGADLEDEGLTYQDIRSRWKVRSGRKVALLFGVLNSRKGLFRVLQALPLLPEADQKQLCLVMAGKIQANERNRARDLIRTLEQTASVQIVLDDRFLTDREIQDIVRGADLVLITYQQHVGSSNVLVRAAAERKPVLGSDYGLVGAHIRRRKLGRAVDTTREKIIAEVLSDFLASPERFPFDPESAGRFATENSASAYAATIFSSLTKSSVPP